MARAKKKLLPGDFGDLLKQGDLAALKAVFDSCDVNARGGSSGQTALAFADCPDALAVWLVGQGADLQAEDKYGETPLHARARHWQGDVQPLIELGADVNHGEGGRGTPLHAAAGAGNVAAVRQLLQRGARAGALNREGQTPLAYALQRCSNIQIAAMAEIAELLLATRPAPESKPGFLGRILGRATPVGDGIAPELKAAVTRIGTTFEFHRDGFNPDLVDAASAGLDRLYVLFDVPPVPRRTMHDGRAPIVARADRWQDRFEELWALLVPARGAPDTVQGEVVRIAGRIHDEMMRNGGGNWDADHRSMADDFLRHIGSGTPLAEPRLAEARRNVAEVKKRSGDTAQLGHLAVEWVALNPWPMKLPPPRYGR